MDIYSLVDEISDKVERFINKNMEQTSELGKLGIDPRASYTLYINEDCVAVPKSNASRFDYYGGAEYVDREYRYELGDYVFYTVDDNRVRGWIDNYYSQDEDSEESSQNGLATA